MSGSIGANRIKRENVWKTVVEFRKNVLDHSPVHIHKTAITGSYNAGIKKDHGDIDLVVFGTLFDASVSIIKKIFAKYCDEHNYLIPFKEGRNIGKKSQIYGSIVTVQAPIVGQPGESVQIDVIFTFGMDEFDFQKNFLNLDAQKQSLLTALVRVVPKYELCIFMKCVEPEWKYPELDENQSVEFALSTAGLSLRKLTLDENYKTLKKEELWRSHDWNHVAGLLGWLDLKLPYESMLQEAAKKYEGERERNRIKGVMKSMINIGRNEAGTPKGDAKQNGINLANEILK